MPPKFFCKENPDLGVIMTTRSDIWLALGSWKRLTLQAAKTEIKQKPEQRKSVAAGGDGFIFSTLSRYYLILSSFWAMIVQARAVMRWECPDSF